MFAKCYSQYYELFNSDKPYKKEIEFVYKWAGNPSRILDIGCGTANYWQHFPHDCFIVGIDSSKEMIAASKHKNRILHQNVLEGFKRTWLQVGLVTALFDVINYIPDHSWWKDLPLQKGGHFIFDIFNESMVKRDGFRATKKTIGSISRMISPLNYDGKKIILEIKFGGNGLKLQELHTMYIWSEKDIESFCGREFGIVEVKNTSTWQQWWKLQRK